jgi:hypothetical protein
LISIGTTVASAFDAYMRENFISRMAEHLRRCFPGECAARSEEDLRTGVGNAMDRAASYGIRTELDVARFLDVGMVYGERFDEDCEWAHSHLKSEKDAAVRMKLVYDEALRREKERRLL